MTAFNMCFSFINVIDPLALRKKNATDKLVEKIVKHDSWPIQRDILHPSLLRLTSRKPLWLDLQPVDIKSRWRHNFNSGGQLSPSVRPHNLAILTPLGNSGLCLTVFARNWDRAVPALGNGDLQTLICVLVARPRRCPTMSNPVPGQNWMAAYLGYTPQMKTLFHGWPIMVDDTHTRRRRSWQQIPSRWSSDSEGPTTKWAELVTRHKKLVTTGTALSLSTGDVRGRRNTINQVLWCSRNQQ